jgi:hypothetical protein
MFKQTTICPTNPKVEVATIDAGKPMCSGQRDGATLKNACAMCEAYRKFVKETV